MSVMPLDPRTAAETFQGTRLRDAAVNPNPAVDFLAPTNAGEVGNLGNPHGPYVVSPEIHGTASRPITPGVVSPTKATQQTAEVAARRAIHKVPAKFVASTAITLGSRVLLADGTTILEVTTAGTTAASAPAAPGAVGGTVVSGTATFTRRQ